MRPLAGKSITLTVRLTLLFATVSTTVLLLLGLLIGTLVEEHFEELDMDLLQGKMELLRHTLGKVRSDRELEALPKHLEDALVGHHGLAVIILKPSGQPLYSTEGAKFPDTFLADARGTSLGPTLWSDPQNHHYRGISAQLPTGMDSSAPLIVALSTDLLHHDHFMRSFRTALWTVMGLAALLTGLLGWIAARRGLAPLREISRNAASITADRLDQRLSTTAIPVELAEVAETLNAMLARLEASFQHLSDFSSDLAHELRTPVSNLLIQTQVTLSRTRTVDEYQNVLASNAEEFERLSRMIADMLFLAKSDNHLTIPHRERVDLAAEVRSLFEFYEAFVEEKGVSLTCTGSDTVDTVFGDRLMLRRAINNLLSNAVRHTPAGGSIAVHLGYADNTDDSSDSEGFDGPTVVLSVENTGETIAPEHMPKLFDRFYRVDASRQHSGEGMGAGLGLAITRSIAHAHNGDVRVRSENGFTTFEIWLPASAKPVSNVPAPPAAG